MEENIEKINTEILKANELKNHALQAGLHWSATEEEIVAREKLNEQTALDHEIELIKNKNQRK